MHLYIDSLGLIQVELRPTGKLLLVLATQAGSLGRVLVESKLGALFGWQSERGIHQSRTSFPSHFATCMIRFNFSDFFL